MPNVITSVSWDEYRALVPQGENPALDDATAMALRDTIILEHLHLTKRIVASMHRGMPQHVEKDDLESWAKIGLMKAIQRFNHELGVPFAAYATQTMRSAIMDYVRDQDWVPRSLRRKQRDIDKADERIKQKHGRNATETEIAVELGIDTTEVGETRHKTEIASHTYLEGSIEALNKQSDLDTDEDALVSELKRQLATQLLALPIREAVIIALYYYANKNLSEIAGMLRMSEAKVGAIHQEAVISLWRNLERILQEEA